MHIHGIRRCIKKSIDAIASLLYPPLKKTRSASQWFTLCRPKPPRNNRTYFDTHFHNIWFSGFYCPVYFVAK